MDGKALLLAPFADDRDIAALTMPWEASVSVDRTGERLCNASGALDGLGASSRAAACAATSVDVAEAGDSCSHGTVSSSALILRGSLLPWESTLLRAWGGKLSHWALSSVSSI